MLTLNFLTISEMKEKYNFEFPFTTYYGLLRAIPTEWKSALRVKAGVLDESENCKTSLKLFSTKEAYSYLIKASQHPQLKAEFYIMGFTKVEIPYIYMLPFKKLERTKTDHVPSQNYSQYFTYPI